MMINFNVAIDDMAIDFNLKRLTNQIYKLLPTREEGEDWEKPLETIVEELAGMSNLLISQHRILFPLLCKLEGLFSLTESDDFFVFRRTIFDCLNLMNSLRKNVNSDT